MKRVLIASHASLFPPEHGGAKNIRHIVEGLAMSGVECRVLVKLHPPVPNRIRFAGQHESGLAEFGSTSELETPRGHLPGCRREKAPISLDATRSQIESFKPGCCFRLRRLARRWTETLRSRGRVRKSSSSSRKLFIVCPSGPFSMRPSEPICSRNPKGDESHRAEPLRQKLHRNASAEKPRRFTIRTFLESPILTRRKP